MTVQRTEVAVSVGWQGVSEGSGGTYGKRIKGQLSLRRTEDVSNMQEPYRIP